MRIFGSVDIKTMWNVRCMQNIPILLNIFMHTHRPILQRGKITPMCNQPKQGIIIIQLLQ